MFSGIATNARNFQSRVPPYVALLPILAGVFVAADDQTVIVTVLPQIMLDLEVQISELDRASWTITGYLLGYVAAMPLIGRISDVWGHRNVFIIAMALFMLGSAIVALIGNSTLLNWLNSWLGTELSPSIDWLIGTRIFQAIGAGALVPVSIAMVGDIFPAHQRGIPFGLMGASAEAGGVIGPLWGGLITRYLDWTWVFWINIPLGIIVLSLLVLFLKSSPRFHQKIDYIGGTLITVSIAALTLGLARVDGPDVLMIGFFFAAIASFCLFILRQRTASFPLLPLTMFQSWAFRAANFTHLLIGAALIIGMVTIPLMANTVQGMTPLDGGLQLMRLTAAIPLGAVLGGFACQRFDYRVPTVTGLALAAIGFWFMSGWNIEIADPSLTLHLVITGFGFGLVIAPIALAATNSVETGDRGTAAGIVTATRIIGMTLGLAALAAWGTGRFAQLIAGIQSPLPMPGEPPEQFQQRLEEVQSQLSEAGFTVFNEFFLVAMALCLVAVVPALLMAWNKSKELAANRASGIEHPASNF